MNPKIMALAYRIWCYAEPRGWDCSVKEIAGALGVSYHSVRNVCHRRNWLMRIRKETTATLLENPYLINGFVRRTRRADISDIIPEWGA